MTRKVKCSRFLPHRLPVAKCVVVDRQAALVTSANFTEAAQQRNIEVGLLIRHAPLVSRISLYFEGLIDARLLARCELS
jgi:phosphatidylserine/phosphatidylglycerophosphate/cardiolipin synthase-like enzyme